MLKLIKEFIILGVILVKYRKIPSFLKGFFYLSPTASSRSGWSWSGPTRSAL